VQEQTPSVGVHVFGAVVQHVTKVGRWLVDYESEKAHGHNDRDGGAAEVYQQLKVHREHDAG
jgi:hypothetical protein